MAEKRSLSGVEKFAYGIGAVGIRFILFPGHHGS